MLEAMLLPSDYERRAHDEIQVWKNPEMGWFGWAVDRLNGVAHQATDVLRKVPGVDYAFDELVPGLLRVVNELSQDTVWHDRIHAEYRQAGHDVRDTSDLRSLDLEEVDAVLRGLDAKYRALAATEGAVAGYAGLPGILPDVVALVALNLRAAGEHAAYCGFDLSEPEERLYALQILEVVSRPSDAAKQLTLMPVVRVSQHVARQQAVQSVEQFALARALQNVARALGIRLTKAKLAQAVPVAGAALGAGFNAYYTSKVCDAAYFLYRERFLQRKYDPSVLES